MLDRGMNRKIISKDIDQFIVGLVHRRIEEKLKGKKTYSNKNWYIDRLSRQIDIQLFNWMTITAKAC